LMVPKLEHRLKYHSSSKLLQHPKSINSNSNSSASSFCGILKLQVWSNINSTDPCVPITVTFVKITSDVCYSSIVVIRQFQLRWRFHEVRNLQTKLLYSLCLYQ
jgi:hypothetical protein